MTLFTFTNLAGSGIGLEFGELAIQGFQQFRVCLRCPVYSHHIHWDPCANVDQGLGFIG